METSEQGYDDLTLLKGIGEKRQTWLREEMNVYQFADLAALSAEELEKRLREAGQTVAKNAVKGWIEGARELSPQGELVENNEGISMPGNDVPTPLPEKAPEWSPLASFVVEYQERLQEGKKQTRTSVHHVEADRWETWPGVVQESLQEWMQVQAGVQPLVDEAVAEKVPPAREEVVTPEKKPVVREAVSPEPVAIKQLLVYQPSKSDKPVAIGEPERPFFGDVQAERECVFAVLFEMPVQNGDLNGNSDIIAQLYAHNLTTHTTTEVPIKPKYKSLPIDDTTRKIEFSNTLLPVGSYRFEVIVREDKPFSSISYLELPILHIY